VTLPLVAVTMGDPTGIGPEIVAKVAASPEFSTAHRAFVIGDAARLSREIQSNGLAVRVRRLDRPEDLVPEAGVLPVYQGAQLPDDLPYGRVDSRAGSAAYAYIRRAVELANARRIDAVCTAPINKEALAAAGVKYPGHTEILADLSGAKDVTMVLMSPELRVILVTIHCSLREAIARLSIDAELTAIRLAHRMIRDLGIARPRIAVAGLNPHAGEGGLFGREDIEIIAPAVQRACNEGIDASGPHPGDTVFMLARRKRYDIVVAQYHDQGLIPVKLTGLELGVNVTAGLPFIRTSPDHGTAFDIAGRGVADATSLRVALEAARDLSRAAGMGSGVRPQMPT
jgi:4-hydroxythreonine-4-phosphate dehydrogenase